jgi:predicted MFS family arabinose efflux permease
VTAAGISVAAAETAAAARTRPALREPQFVAYLIGQSVSQLGNMVWYVALSWSAIQLGSPGTAGLLMILSSLPTTVLSLFGGVIVDRHDVRRLMIGSDVLRTLVTLAAAALALLHPGIVLLAVLALTFGVVNAVFQPAAGSMQPRLLRPEQYSNGQMLGTVAGRLALSLGGPLGGLAVASGGLPLGLLVDAATFAVSVATLVMVRPRALPAADAVSTERAGALAEFKAGCAFMFRHRVLGPLSVAILLMELGFIGPMNVGLAVLSDERGWGARGIGLMLTGFGLGSVGGAILTNRLRIRSHVGIWIAGSAVLSGAAVLGTGLATGLPAAVAVAALVGACSGPPNVLGNTVVQLQTPDHLRGRVSAFQTQFGLGIVPLAMLSTGYAITAFGVHATYAACAAVEAAALLTLLSPAFRHARVEQAGPDGPDSPGGEDGPAGEDAAHARTASQGSTE